jgi:hypothetical protein
LTADNTTHKNLAAFYDVRLYAQSTVIMFTYKTIDDYSRFSYYQPSLASNKNSIKISDPTNALTNISYNNLIDKVCIF